METVTKICTKCLQPKSIQFFARRAKAKDGLTSWCSVCKNADGSRYYLVTKQAIRPKRAAYRLRNLDQIKRKNQEYYLRSGGLSQKQYGERLKEEFFNNYSDVCQGPTGSGDCIYGGITDCDLLTLAHLNSDGAEHRRRIKSNTTANLMLDLRKRGWPKNEGISVQCHNCQWKQLANERRLVRQKVA